MDVNHMQRSKLMRTWIVVIAMLAMMSPVMGLAASDYDGGFKIKNDEGTFSLKLSGKMQVQFLFKDSKDASSALYFRMRRGSMGVNMQYNDRVTLGFSLLHTTGSAGEDKFQNMNLSGAEVGIKIFPWLNVDVGMVGLPLDMGFSSSWLLLPEAPSVQTRSDQLGDITPLASSFGAPDGLGVRLTGEYWKMFYEFGVVSSRESNYDINKESKGMSVGFRTGINIFDAVGSKLTDYDCSTTPKLTVSVGSIYQGSRIDSTLASNNNPAPPEIENMWTSSLGAAFRLAGLSVTAQGYYREIRFNSLGTAGTIYGGAGARLKFTDIGYMLSAGYYIIPKKFEVAAQASQTIRQQAGNDSWSFGGGVNWYAYDNYLKLQLGYQLQKHYDWIEGVNNSGQGTYAYTSGNAEHNVVLMMHSTF